MVQAGSRSAPSPPPSHPGDAGLGAQMVPPTAQPKQQALAWLGGQRPQNRGAYSQCLSPICPLLWQWLQQAGMSGPPVLSHKPPWPRCPPEAHSALPGLPGKQLLFCLLLVLARASAGSTAASPLHGAWPQPRAELSAGCSPKPALFSFPRPAPAAFVPSSLLPQPMDVQTSMSYPSPVSGEHLRPHPSTSLSPDFASLRGMARRRGRAERTHQGQRG